MGNICSGTFHTFGTDTDIFNIVKTKAIWLCSSCWNNIDRGNYVFGKGHSKICSKCMKKFLRNMNKGIDEYKKLILDFEEEYKKRKKEIEDSNFLKTL